MFQNIDLVYILIPVFIITAGFMFYTKNRFPIATGLKYRTIIFGIVLILLWFALPSTPSLSSFGHPYDVSDINTPEKILKYLQKYNDAIVRTTEVVHWMLFTLVFWFLATFLDVIKLIDSNNNEDEVDA
jgi:hypothetical protein